MTDYGRAALNKIGDLSKETNKRKISIPPILQKYPKTMSSPPTITQGANGGASIITGGIQVPILTKNTPPDIVINPLFKFLGKPKRADWDGVIYKDNAPDYNFVKNIAVTPLSGYLSVAFCYDGSEFEFTLKGLTGNKYNILVDEGNGYEYVFTSAQPGPPSGGGVYKMHVNFGSKKQRKIILEIASTFLGHFYIGGNDTIFPISEQKKTKAIWFGDSNPEGTGANSPHEAMASIASKLLGWDGWNSGSGGTGYVNPGSVNGRVKFVDRLDSDVVAFSPDVVVVVGGNNDDNGNYTNAQVESEVRNFFTQLKTKLPNAQIICVSNMAKRTPAYDAQINVNNIIKSVVLPMGLPLIDSINGITYGYDGIKLNDGTGNWYTGTGSVTSQQAIGNVSKYLSSDGAHCSPDGHMYTGIRLATEIYRILNS